MHDAKEKSDRRRRTSCVRRYFLKLTSTRSNLGGRVRFRLRVN